MHVVCAPDSYKETLAGRVAAEAMVRGVHAADVGATADAFPIADGGEGTLDVVIANTDCRVVAVPVCGPLPRTRRIARYAIVPNPHPIAVVELAEAAGLEHLQPADRNPLRTTTFGVGELMRHAIDVERAVEIILTVGGSATVDGGLGILQALGATITDSAGIPIDEPITGGELGRVAGISEVPGLPPISVACDVNNRLLGPRGAAAVYGPQKGASKSDVAQLEAGLRHLTTVIPADANAMGMGAAGGVPFGLSRVGTTVCRGAELILAMTGFEKRCTTADLVITGEGRLDGQSLHGKAVMEVAACARRAGATPVAIVGALGDGWEACVGPEALSAVICLADVYGHDKAIGEVERCVEREASEVVRSFRG